MAYGFMFRIINQTASTLTFTSSNYQNTGDISPFNVTVPPGGTAPGAPQNPGYYYFEQEDILKPASFNVTASPGENSAGPAVTIFMLMSANPDAPPGSSLLVPVIQAEYASGGSNISVLQTGTTGADNWPVGTIAAQFQP